MSCERVGISKWCSGLDVRLVQLKSAHNVYHGRMVWMCRACRKANVGGFRIVMEAS